MPLDGGLPVARELLSQRRMMPPLVCLVVADSAQARWYSLDDSAPGATLRECGRLLQPSDATQHPDLERDQRFAAAIAAEATAVIDATRCRSVLLVARGDMLVLLRTLLSALTAKGISLVTVPGDLVHESAPHVHDHLAQLGFVPGRRADPA